MNIIIDPSYELSRSRQPARTRAHRACARAHARLHALGGPGRAQGGPTPSNDVRFSKNFALR
eukprot:5922040-Karenia_brevis.AAC.1